MKDWDTAKATCQRLFSKDIKTYVVEVSGQPGQTIKIPKGGRVLGITQPYLALQVYIPRDAPFGITLTIETASKSRARIYFSTATRYTKLQPLQVRLPLHVVTGAWTTFVIDMIELTRLCPRQEFCRLDQVEISPRATILRVFSLFKCPLPTIELYSELDVRDHARNPRLPPFPFSRRQHQPLDVKLQTPSTHIQIADLFYSSIFDEKKVHHDVAVRDAAGALEARRAFMEGFNEPADGAEVRGVDVAGTAIQLQAGAIPQYEDDIDEITNATNAALHVSQATAGAAAAQRAIREAAALRQAQNKKEIEKMVRKSQVQQQKAALAASTAMQLKQRHEEVERQRAALEQQLRSMRGAAPELEQQKREKLQKLEGNRRQALMGIGAPPPVLGASEVENDIDLTLNAVPVDIHVTDGADPRSISPVVRRQGAQVEQVTPKPLNNVKSVIPQHYADYDIPQNQDDIYQMEQRVPRGTPQRDRIAEKQEMYEYQYEYRQDQNDHNTLLQQKEQQAHQSNQQLPFSQSIDNAQEDEKQCSKNIDNASEDYDRSAWGGTGDNIPFEDENYNAPNSVQRMKRTDVRNDTDLPDPDEAGAPIQDALPDPADAPKQGPSPGADPVAYGLRYDPATDCYYEDE